MAIFMCNLKAAKMRGVFSHGMIMCGSTPDKVEIIQPPAGVQVGDRVYVDGYEGTLQQREICGCIMIRCAVATYGYASCVVSSVAY